MKPLSPEEKAVFGHDAVRLSDGSIQERGTGSAFHREQVAATLRREATCRGEAPAAPTPPPPPAVDYQPDVRSPYDPLYKGRPYEPAATVPRIVRTPEDEGAPAAPVPERTIDPRLIHDWPTRTQ